MTSRAVRVFADKALLHLSSPLVGPGLSHVESADAPAVSRKLRQERDVYSQAAPEGMVQAPLGAACRPTTPSLEPPMPLLTELGALCATGL
jgi:hypothetical protein